MRLGIVVGLIALLAGSSTWAAESSDAFVAAKAPDEEPQHTVRILRTTNKAQTNRYVPKVYELKNVNPANVLRFFRRVMEIEEGRWATFVAPDGKSGLVAVTAPEYQIPYIDKLMQVIDTPDLTSSSGDEGMYIRLNHRAADDRGFLNTILGQAMHTATRSPRGDPAPDGDLIADLETGSIFVYAAPSIVERVTEVISELDKPTPQVLIDATVYEIDLNNDGAIGFDYYAWKNGPGRNAFALGAFAEYGKVDNYRGGQDLLYDPGLSNTYGLPHNRFRNHGYNAAWFLDVSTAFFDFLVTKGAARVVTEGRVLSRIPTTYASGLNEFGQVTVEPFEPDSDLGPPAEFRAGDQVVYYRVVTGESPRAGVRPAGYMLDPYGDTEDYPDERRVVARKANLAAEGTEILNDEIASVDVGVDLRVTPRIASENILLDLELEVSSLLGFDGRGEPRISARRAIANVRVQDGEEVCFGGLERTTRIQSTNKFPILGSLPGLGWLFGREGSGVKKTLVITVIRATRLETGMPSDDAATIAEVSGEAETPLPPDSFGFDQWLLDKHSKDKEASQ